MPNYYVMSHVAEIASQATKISADKLAEASENVGIKVLKKQIDIEAQMQMELANMLQSIQPHLGGNVNVSA